MPEDQLPLVGMFAMQVTSGVPMYPSAHVSGTFVPMTCEKPGLGGSAFGVFSSGIVSQ